MRFVACTHDAHAGAILEILNEAIVNSTALYDYKPRPAEAMAGWFKAKDAGRFPVIGALGDQALLGFASYGSFRAWPAYKYTVEHSVYVHRDHRGKGIGIALMRKLLDAAREQDYHVMVGGIDATNAASLKLHAKFGFEQVAHFRQVGWKFERWLDLVFLQRIF